MNIIITNNLNPPITPKRNLSLIKNIIETVHCDLIVFMGDIVHGPDFDKCQKEYEKYLREVLDLTNGIPFATIFGNHDDECDITKKEILRIVKDYPNAVTKAANYTIEMEGETLLFIDSGSYYEGDSSFYDTVKPETIEWAKQQIKEKQAILFQHIIVPDVMEYIDEKKIFGKRLVKFKSGLMHTGALRERPCPPDINTGELPELSLYLKGAVFAHDHYNDFEFSIGKVRIIQCGGAGYNSYEKCNRRSIKLLDTHTMTTKKIYIQVFDR